MSDVTNRHGRAAGENPSAAALRQRRTRARQRGEDVPLLVSTSPCGTVAAYQRHLRKHEAPCDLCQSAADLPRVCARCHLTKPGSEFSSLTAPYCRPCRSDYEKGRTADRVAQDPAYTRMLNLRRYGLTPEQFAAMLGGQGGRCAICGTAEPGGQGWHVDHDHACCNTRKQSCGECTRGILCTRCNIGLGNFRDDPVTIQAALNYVLVQRSALEGRRAKAPLAAR